MKSLPAIGCALALLSASAQAQVALRIQPSERICLVGGGLGESLDESGAWEALLHTRFADRTVSVRNLCVPGDEVIRRLRPEGFGTPTEQLTREKASVVIGFFGFSESFAGQEGVEKFRTDLAAWVDATLAAKYAGDGAPSPRVALVSPVAAEPLPGVDSRRLNLNLKLYAEAIRAVAAQKQVAFADLFTATEKTFGRGGLTNNGVTPNPQGQMHVAVAINNALFGRAAVREPEPELLAAVQRKNLLYRHRYRPSNGASVYGSRASAVFEPDRTVTIGAVLAREMEILDALCAAGDVAIWKAAGSTAELAEVPPPPAPIAVESNFGSGKNRGKEGSLEYLKPSQAKRRFRLEDGFAIDLWASELDFPELANPSAFCFDGRGRMWVACMPGYPGFRPAPGENSAPADRILVIDDFDHDGRADRCKVFAEGLHLPTGLAVGDGGVYVAAAPDLLFLKDTDGDGKADLRERLLTGFGTANAHHGIAALRWGPGGWLYFAEGSFDTSNIETARGTLRVENSGVYRYHPRSKVLELYAACNFTNPKGIAFDDWGNVVIADAATGSMFFGNPLSGDLDPGTKHGAARPFAKARSNPVTACEFVVGKHFPEALRGDLLLGSCIGMLGALRYDLTHADSDSFYSATEARPLALTTDGNFRPVDLGFGPDGALYLCDWHNALLGHFEHSLRDPNRDGSRGRIWRVTHRGSALDPWPRTIGPSPTQLLPLLENDNPKLRHQAKMALRQLPQQAVLAAAIKWGGGLDRRAGTYGRSLLEILYLHEHFAAPNPRLLRSVLRHEDPRVRAAATRILTDWRNSEPGSLAMLRVLAGDDDPRVRLEAVRSASFFRDPRALEVLQTAAGLSMDAPLQFAYDEALAIHRKRFPAPPPEPTDTP